RARAEIGEEAGRLAARDVDRARDRSAECGALAHRSPTCQGSPRSATSARNGSGSSCSMLNTPALCHFFVTIIAAPVTAGTPVVYETACARTSLYVSAWSQML